MPDSLVLARVVVPTEWVDYNGHMNDATYAHAFGLATDGLMDHVGLDGPGRTVTGCTVYTLSALIRYLAEVKGGAALTITGRVLAHDEKRLHLWLTMTRDADGAIAAFGEQVMACIDHRAQPPRMTTWPSAIGKALDRLVACNVETPWPTLAGQGLVLNGRPRPQIS